MGQQAVVLSIEGLTRRFGGLTAVDDLTFSVTEGAIHGLIGPNGAGKTTTFNVISGFYRPTSGRVIYSGRDISGMATHAVAALGLVRTFQATTLFHELTVAENVLAGCHLGARIGLASVLLGRQRERQEQAQARVEEILAFMGLDAVAGESCANLPHGLQRTLGVAVALAAEPRLLLLDEPFTGMNPDETRRMMNLVRQVRDRGVTILLVEHDMQAVMGLCETITVLNFGSLLAEGDPEAIRANPEVVDAYLGTPIEGVA
ncbi:MAG: ABC transporter ATP-binding protein [bacterium]|nr:ABC transporter ATP-binding protein [bacterium]